MVLKITNLHILKYLPTCWLYLLECYTIDNQRCTHAASANDVIVTIRHNPLVQRALQHAFSIPLLMDSNGF